MAGHIINGERWIRERLQFLRERLADAQLAEVERQAIEAEIEALNHETGFSTGGHRFPAFLRRRRRTRR